MLRGLTMKLKRAIYTALTLAAISPWTNAVEVIDGQYVWRFASGEAWPVGYDKTTGKPDNLTYRSL